MLLTEIRLWRGQSKVYLANYILEGLSSRPNLVYRSPDSSRGGDDNHRYVGLFLSCDILSLFLDFVNLTFRRL